MGLIKLKDKRPDGVQALNHWHRDLQVTQMNFGWSSQVTMMSMKVYFCFCRDDQGNGLSGLGALCGYDERWE